MVNIKEYYNDLLRFIKKSTSKGALIRLKKRGYKFARQQENEENKRKAEAINRSIQGIIENTLS